MRILVLNPATAKSGNVIRDVLYGCWCGGKRIGGATLPPFGLLQVATILKQEGHEVVFLDAQGERKRPQEVERAALGAELLVASTSTMTFREDAAQLQDLKRAHPRLKTLVFGSHPTFMPKSTMAQPGIDFAVRHEPEFIVRQLARGGDLSAVPSLCYRVDGEARFNPPAEDPGSLDELPFLDVSLLPKGVRYYNPLVKRLPYITAVTSKGCPAQCTFCTAPAFDGHSVRFQSAEYVLRAIEHYLRQGIREVYFRDDTFFVNKNRDHRICREIVERELDVTWLANARVAMIDEPTMELARRAGCHTIKLGVESGSQEILDRIKKGHTLSQAREAFRAAKRVGLSTHAHVMLGNPGETLETIERTLDFVEELSPTTATFGICTPYPGTPLFNEVAKDHPEIEDGTATDLSLLHVDGLFNEIFTMVKREDLRRAVRSAYRRFYLRPSYWGRTLRGIGGLAGARRVGVAAKNVLEFSLGL